MIHCFWVQLTGQPLHQQNELLTQIYSLYLSICPICSCSQQLKVA